VIDLDPESLRHMREAVTAFVDGNGDVASLQFLGKANAADAGADNRYSDRRRRHVRTFAIGSPWQKAPRGGGATVSEEPSVIGEDTRGLNSS
jgi:hypothetical protein